MAPEPQASYTAAELAEFDRLTWLVSSPNQLERIEGRLYLQRFVDAHGKAKCEAMWQAIKHDAENGGEDA